MDMDNGQGQGQQPLSAAPLFENGRASIDSPFVHLKAQSRTRPITKVHAKSPRKLPHIPIANPPALLPISPPRKA